MEYIVCSKLYRIFLCLLLVVPMGCAIQPSSQYAESVEVAFSPEGGSEALILKVLGSARQSVRLAAYSFTSPAIVRSLIDAKRRGVDVKVLVDDRGNRGQASIAVMNLIAGAGIPLRSISAYTIHHDRYIVVDKKHVETGSFNYSQAATKSNSENDLVIWNNPTIASRYLVHWESRWIQGSVFEQTY